MTQHTRSLPAVHIVILNWNNAPDTLACLQSVAQLTYPNYTALVVDNGSTDSSTDRVHSAFPDTEILELKANLGYAEGNNAGIRRAIESGADYVFVLNNDTLIAPDALAELVEAAESRPQIGMVGPLMRCADPPDTLFAAGSFIAWAKGETWHRGMFEPAERYAALQQPEPVDFVSGCGVLVRRQLIERAGALDTSFYLNYEDVEWAVRARRFGHQAWLVPKAVLWHKISATLGRTSPANVYYMTRNELFFFWRNGPRHLRGLAAARIVLRTLRTIGAWTLGSQYQTSAFRVMRDANLLALRDFFQGRSGKMDPDVAAVCYPN